MISRSNVQVIDSLNILGQIILLTPVIRCMRFIVYESFASGECELIQYRV